MTDNLPEFPTKSINTEKNTTKLLKSTIKNIPENIKTKYLVFSLAITTSLTFGNLLIFGSFVSFKNWNWLVYSVILVGFISFFLSYYFLLIYLTLWSNSQNIPKTGESINFFGKVKNLIWSK